MILKKFKLITLIISYLYYIYIDIKKMSTEKSCIHLHVLFEIMDKIMDCVKKSIFILC
jgi:hypothetical protein